MKKKIIKVGIVGCGAMGSTIAAACNEGKAGSVKLTAIFDADEKKMSGLAARLRMRIAVPDIKTLIKRSDLIVESAAPAVVPDILTRRISSRKDCLIMSVGGTVGHP